MNRDEIYRVLRTISLELSGSDDTITLLPEKPDWEASLEDLKIDILSGQEFFPLLEERIPTKSFKVPPGLLEKLQVFRNLGELCDHLLEKGFDRRVDKEVVYVDDEPENIFIFKRKFGKSLNLKTFEDPVAALEYIIRTPQVALVITDEVMPRLSGNELCDETKKAKPNMKFILMTGNPNHDGDLMYRALRKDRFYEFINKPVDFENKGDEYLAMIQGLVSFDW
ncbi:MAG: response regulator [Fibrobacteria bacterium]